MILIDSLKKKLRNKVILNNVSLTVPKGTVYGLLGLNGAGKSTTIKTILGFVKPTSGTVTISTANIGYLPENPYYYDHLTLRELLNFSLVSSKVKKTDNKKKISHYAELVGMAENLDKRLRTFSKGMVQRSGIAAALIHEPELVILDEPMSGLDPLGRRLVFDIVMNLRANGATVLLCSHILNDVEQLCDNIAIMNKGEIVCKTSREELLKTPSQLEVIFNKSSDLIESLNGQGYTDYHSTIGVTVTSVDMTEFITSMDRKGFTAQTVKSSGSLLEKLFISKVKSGS